MQDKENKNTELLKTKITTSKKKFAQMRQQFPNRITIVSEGDSWFAYPPNWLFVGEPSNLINYISSATLEKANFLTLAACGDEMIDMISGKQKHLLVDILRWHSKAKGRKHIDLLLYSGGGNDLVGEDNFERFLKPYNNSYVTGKQCVNLSRLNRKVKQIGMAYQELLDIRDHYSPKTLIITHTYDYPYPSLTGGEFLGGLIKTEGWMKRFMDTVGIKDEIQVDVIKVFIDAIAEELLQVAAKRKRFIVVDSRGTIDSKEEWRNEIHPTSKGFKILAKLLFAKMKEVFPELV